MLIYIHVNARLPLTSSLLCISKKEVVQIDIFHLKYNSLSMFLFLNFFLFLLISSHLIIIKKEATREKKERLHTFSFPLSLSLSFNNTILAFAFSPSFLLRFLCTHIQVYIHFLYQRVVTKVEHIYRTYIYNIVDMHTIL
jgi:hypothetical protein